MVTPKPAHGGQGKTGLSQALVLVRRCGCGVAGRDFLFKRELQQRHDFRLWIDCSFETALERAIAHKRDSRPPLRLLPMNAFTFRPNAYISSAMLPATAQTSHTRTEDRHCLVRIFEVPLTISKYLWIGAITKEQRQRCFSGLRTRSGVKTATFSVWPLKLRTPDFSLWKKTQATDDMDTLRTQ